MPAGYPNPSGAAPDVPGAPPREEDLAPGVAGAVAAAGSVFDAVGQTIPGSESTVDEAVRRDDLTAEEATQEILKEFAEAGIDTDKPEVLLFAGSQFVIDAYKTNRTVFDGVVATAVQNYSTTVATNYQTAREQLGFSSGTLTPPTDTSGAITTGFEQVGQAVSASLGGYEVNEDTGGIMFANGVIFDPNSETVLYPNSSTAQGSIQWLNASRGAWSEDQIKEWKSKLVDMGYLPKGAAKDGTWTSSFETALRGYFDNKYKHLGDPVPIDDMEQAVAPAQELKAMKASIYRDTEQQYLTSFGEKPDPDELDHWLDFVTRTAKKLMRTGSFSSTGAAASESILRAGIKMEQSPYGQYISDQQENTELRDRMQAAAQAASTFN